MQLRSSLIALCAVASSASAAVVVDFVDKPLATNSFSNPTGGFTSNGVFFNNDLSIYGTSSGFTLSTVNDTTTPGYTNSYAAITGAGVGSSGTYAVAYPKAYFNVPMGLTVDSVRLTNTTYAALSMQQGDSFAKKFGGASGNDPDYFKVTFTGFASTGGVGATAGSSTFYLADFRGAGTASDYIVKNWSTLDLTSLGDARSVGLSFASSDVGAYGINTPTYVAIDDLTLVPEPATLAALAGLTIVARRRR